MSRIISLLCRVKSKFISFRNISKVKGKPKIFCIGRNKTGTTSLRRAFEDLGFIVGQQLEAEYLADKLYFKGEFQPIIKYCESAEVFQDIPFSWPDTYKYLDEAYPNSKFILTVRDDPEQWYESLVNFHSKLFTLTSSGPPTVRDLKNSNYVRRGFMYNTVKIHGTPDNDPYNREIMVAHYEKYNGGVIEYFKDRPRDFLVLNIADKGAYQKFISFLGVDSSESDFPWENKT